MADRNKAVNALADALTAGERAADARDQAVADRDVAVRALEAAQARIAELEAALADAKTGQQGPVVVLPGMAVSEAPVGPITTGNRVAWRPTWSEWARPDADEATHDVVDVTTAEEIHLDEAGGAGEASGVCRYLNVAATIAQLLPEDLGPLLMSGATIVRREGRLFATVAITTGNWAEPGADTAQAQRFADAGFRVEWASTTPLGV
jgi:hypothetical protein